MNPQTPPAQDNQPKPRTLDEWKQAIKALEQCGQLFKAYDTALEALDALEYTELKDNIWLQHRAVLCLANAGATQLAREKYQFFKLDARGDSESVTLDARILKQVAFRADAKQRESWFKTAITRYESAWKQLKVSAPNEAYYPAINVATLSFLNGQTNHAHAIASEVLACILPQIKQQDRAADDLYWLQATAAEAYLIKGEFESAREYARAAAKIGAGNFANLASTARQLDKVLRHQKWDLARFGVYGPPAVVHYTGHMLAKPGENRRLPLEDVTHIAAEIKESLDKYKPIAGYGSLSAGSDILFAEALLALNAKLNIVLPFNKEEFINISVRPFGEDWVSRFEDCIKKATTVRYATEDEYLGDDSLFNYCSQIAMGLAVLCARHLSGTVHQIAVWDGLPQGAVAGTARDIALWRQITRKQVELKSAGSESYRMEQTILRCGSGPNHPLEEVHRSAIETTGRTSRAMLFGDFKGFSKLKDRQIPIFSSLVMGKVAKVFEKCSEGQLFTNTWGDGIYAVYGDAGKAAETALQLQEAISVLPLKDGGLPEDLSLRLGGHLGPVFGVDDPVLKCRTFMGSHVSRTARIEPITPEKSVYVTESMAAILALYNADQFTCEYVGVTEAAKHYGSMRMFLLRRATTLDQESAAVCFIDQDKLDPPTERPKNIPTEQTQVWPPHLT